MSNTIPQTPSSIKGTFRFIQWQDIYKKEKPFQILTQIPKDSEFQRTTNLVFEDDEVDIQDARTLSVAPTLDTHGFMLKRHALPNTDFTVRKSVEDSYFADVERLIKSEVKGAKQVYIFDWRLRNTMPESGPGTVLDFNDRTSYLRPAIHFHVDQSPAGVLNRILQQLKDQSATLLKQRVRVINIWRPLVDCVGDWPLAMCDGSTVDPEDFIETDHIRRHYQGSSWYLQRREKQKFYYYSRQSKEDVLFIKIFDSKQDGIKAPYGPHAAFKLNHEEFGGMPRSSIEVRCLVFDSDEVQVPSHWVRQIEDNQRYEIDDAAGGEMFLVNQHQQAVSV